jgi:hypothetical protein
MVPVFLIAARARPVPSFELPHENPLGCSRASEWNPASSQAERGEAIPCLLYSDINGAKALISCNVVADLEHP